jgi:hypothetical protein
MAIDDRRLSAAFWDGYWNAGGPDQGLRQADAERRRLEELERAEQRDHEPVDDVADGWSSLPWDTEGLDDYGRVFDS